MVQINVKKNLSDRFVGFKSFHNYIVCNGYFIPLNVVKLYIKIFYFVKF